MKAFSPLAAIGLWDPQAGEARAMRIRQLATPSWLSTRPNPLIEQRAAPVRTARETVVRTAPSTWSPLRGRKYSVFLARAPCRRQCEAHDCVARAITHGTTAPSVRWCTPRPTLTPHVERSGTAVAHARLDEHALLVTRRRRVVQFS